MTRSWCAGLVAGLACCPVAAMRGQVAAEPVPLLAQAIMTHVAENQDRAEALRRHFVYVQRAHVASRKGRRVLCEETTESRVTPSAKGSSQQLLTLQGRVWQEGKYVTYTTMPARTQKQIEEDRGTGTLSIAVGEEDADRRMVEHMRANLLNNDTRDGINGDLFPLTTKQQALYTFQLLGRERLNARDVYHLRFTPKVADEYGWKGDAYVDTTAFEPVVIRTDLSRKIPAAVRVLMGTNVPGLGFSVVYAPQLDGLWMPTSFGTEFKVHVLFFFHRDIVVEAKNFDFEKTHVQSTILAAEPGAEPQR